MVRSVLDTNVLISGTILPRGTPFSIMDAWRHGRFRLVTTEEQIVEIARVVRRPRIANKYGLDEAGVEALLRRLARDTDIVSIVDRVLPVSVRDPDDARILASALIGRANFLVSGDQDLLVLAGDPALGALRIVTPGAFLDCLDRDHEGTG